MHAQIIAEFGEPDVLQPAELPDPTPGPTQVLVRQVATSVNPVDYKLRAAGHGLAPELPAVLGCDVAGTVAAIGSDVTTFAVGDAVYGAAGGVKGMGGSYAELIATDARLLAPAPTTISLREAAALPLVTITAWEGLDRAGVKSGDTVLVRGGTGGVGHVAIQLARARGARVFATASSPQKAAIARRLGADDTIDYRAETPDAYVKRLTDGRGFDVVFDATGGSDIATAFASARLNGQVVTIVAGYQADLAPMHAKGLSLHVVFMLIPMLHDTGREVHGRILREASALVEAGKLEPLIDPERFTLDRIADAHRKAESGRPLGKIVVEIGDG